MTAFNSVLGTAQAYEPLFYLRERDHPNQKKTSYEWWS
jgi:hypothetical protein